MAYIRCSGGKEPTGTKPHMTTIGWQHDKIGYKKSILCYIGIHRATRYVIVRIDGIDYFVCKDCGKRYKII